MTLDPEPRTTTGRWLAEWLVNDGAIDRLPDGWDDPNALIAKVESEAGSATTEPDIRVFETDDGLGWQAVDDTLGTVAHGSTPEEARMALGNDKGPLYAVAARAESILDEAVLSDALGADERRMVHLSVDDSATSALLRKAVEYGYQRGGADVTYSRGYRADLAADNFIGEQRDRALLADVPDADEGAGS